MASILETRSITKKFGGFTAVDNVSLTVDPGEIRFITVSYTHLTLPTSDLV